MGGGGGVLGEGSGEAGRQGGEGEGKPRGANGPGIGEDHRPRPSSRVILTGDPCWVWRPRVGHINGPPQNLPLLG